MLDGDKMFDLLFELGYPPTYMEEETELVITCPFPNCRRDEKFYISVETGQWMCFHCKEYGSLIQFFQQCLDMSYHEAYDHVRKVTLRDGRTTGRASAVGLRAGAAPVSQQGERDYVELPQSYHPLAEWLDAPPAQPFLEYLRGRNITDDLIQSKQVGFCIQGYYAQRVIFPVRTNGVLYSYVARSILKRCPHCTLPISDCICQDEYKKALTPAGGHPTWTLYNFDRVRLSGSSRVLVGEGVFDALRSPDEGTALLGSNFSMQQANLLAYLYRQGRQIILCLDPDEAGAIGKSKAGEMLVSNMVRPYIWGGVPKPYDLADAPEELFEEAIANVKEFTFG